MTRALRIFTWAANVLVGGSGLVLWVMAWLMESDDPYAIVNHPGQPLAQHLHVLLAPLLVWNIGSIWVMHAWPYFRSPTGKRRLSGLLLLTLAAPMVFSGVALQISVQEASRNLWAWIHVLSSIVWIAAFLFHALARLRTR